MGKPRAVRKVLRPSPGQDGAAVTPVIGAVLILAITILGIAGILLWGAPLIERIQAQNAQTAIVGEFEEVRDASRELSVPDHSRFPTLVVPRGELSLQQGSRVMVTVDHAGPTSPNCDLHVTNWADNGASKGVATVSFTNCPSSAVQVFAVSGGTLSPSTTCSGAFSSGNTVSAADFSKGDWMFRLLDPATCTSSTPTVYAEAWLHSSDAVDWVLKTSSGTREVTLDNGAIFSKTDSTSFIEKDAVIGDSLFGSSYYGLGLRSLSANSYSAISGSGDHQVYLSLIGTYDRVETTGAYRLRYDVAGSLAESWCNALELRNPHLTAASYKSQQANCGQITSDGVRSICYVRVASSTCSTVPTTAFTFRFVHARIYTSLAV